MGSVIMRSPISCWPDWYSLAYNCSLELGSTAAPLLCPHTKHSYGQFTSVNCISVAGCTTFSSRIKWLFSSVSLCLCLLHTPSSTHFVAYLLKTILHVFIQLHLKFIQVTCIIQFYGDKFNLLTILLNSLMIYQYLMFREPNIMRVTSFIRVLLYTHTLELSDRL